MDLKSQLLILGLSTNEACVYLALVQHGACGAGALITATGLHRNIVYTSLSHLAARKLVSEKQVRGAKQFAATSPNALVDEFEHKSALAKVVSGALQQKLQEGLQEITVHQGNEEYLSVLTAVIKTLPPGSFKYVLGTGGQAFMRATMRPIWDRYHEVAKAQDIHIRMLGYENQRQAIEGDVTREGIYEVRYLPNTFENPAGLHIYPEAQTVLNIIYSDDSNPVTAIRIKNGSLAKGYLGLFRNLWSMASA